MGDFVGSGGVLGGGVIGDWEDLVLGGKEGDGEGRRVSFLLGAAVVGDSLVGTAVEGGGEGLRVGIADGGKDGGGEGRCVGGLDEGSMVLGDSRVTSSSSTKHGFTRKLPSLSSSSSPVSSLVLCPNMALVNAQFSTSFDLQGLLGSRIGGSVRMATTSAMVLAIVVV
mmetsp:Transcript_29858/g.48994  ORF Transcript_29858/g.48994 Transcript_29858/m.48994 type:complete len:168 (-) Transcript_29858:294-797(-)